jgi:hypothetical protein
MEGTCVYLLHSVLICRFGPSPLEAYDGFVASGCGISAPGIALVNRRGTKGSAKCSMLSADPWHAS